MPRMRGGFAELSSGFSLAQVAIRVSAAFHASSFDSNAVRSKPCVSSTCILLQKVHTDAITSNPISTLPQSVAFKSTCHESTGTFTCHTGNSPYKQMNTLLSSAMQCLDAADASWPASALCFMTTSHLYCTSCYQKFIGVLVMYPLTIMVLVAVRSEYSCCHDLHHCKDFLFSKILRLNSSFAFLSLSCLNMLSAALASSFRDSEALISPDTRRLRCVPASFVVLLWSCSSGGFLWSCSFTVGADFEAAGVTWVHIPGPSEPGTILTETQLE